MKSKQLDIQSEIKKREEANKPLINAAGEWAPWDEPEYLCSFLGHSPNSCVYTRTGSHETIGTYGT